MHRRATGGGGALREVSRLGKLAQAGRTSTGVFRSERRAARRSSPLSQGRRRGGFKKRKVVEAIVPARHTRVVWFGCPHVVTQLQKSSGGVWSRISSVIALQKQRQDRVNGDLARSERRWMKPSTGAASERSVGVSGQFPERTGRVRTKTHGGARVPSSGRPITQKVVCRSRDRGCSGHRILRRVPVDRRHPGSHEVSAFTRRC